MCLALPARVLAVESDHALIEIDGRVRRASLLRMPEVSVGDWALVAAGSVLRRLEPDEAIAIDRLLRGVLPEPSKAAAPGGSR
jgi:hydrogenase expression/formation protein HypC